MPVGVPGDSSHLAGEGSGAGVLERAGGSATAEQFVANPGVCDARRRRECTGREISSAASGRAEGNIRYLGRVDYQVKLRGFRIELGEIEALLNRHASVRQSLVMVREGQNPGMQRLAAYLVPSSDEIAKLDNSSATEQVSDWTAAWEESYREAANASDVTFNIAGWNSSYTLQPIPTDEMRAWVDSTVARILRLRPKRVWQIGCGSGLLALPDCGPERALPWDRYFAERETAGGTLRRYLEPCAEFAKRNACAKGRA